MRTKVTIMVIVLTAIASAIGLGIGLIIWLGVVQGLSLFVAAAGGLVLAYWLLVGPWQHRWGATDEEVRRTMPGDEILPGAAGTTRAILIPAPPEKVWPWLAQIGYGRAGWYSYDWIDNDGRPSADRIVPELQDLKVGDRILMIPDMGAVVREIEPNRYILAGDAEGGTWCLAIYPEKEGRSRLVSRWRQEWPITPATAFWILISDPGTFIMERRMLKGIKRRVEQATGPSKPGARAAGPGARLLVGPTSPST